jgi:excinuclease UvrABC helicase subunit UvrB
MLRKTLLCVLPALVPTIALANANVQSRAQAEVMVVSQAYANAVICHYHINTDQALKLLQIDFNSDHEMSPETIAAVISTAVLTAQQKDNLPANVDCQTALQRMPELLSEDGASR